jgi:hypothetical protein
VQKTKTARQDEDTGDYREISVFQDRRVDSVRRNFAISIDRNGNSVSINNGQSRMKRQLNKN